MRALEYLKTKPYVYSPKKMKILTREKNQYCLYRVLVFVLFICRYLTRHEHKPRRYAIPTGVPKFSNIVDNVSDMFTIYKYIFLILYTIKTNYVRLFSLTMVSVRVYNIYNVLYVNIHSLMWQNSLFDICGKSFPFFYFCCLFWSF